MFLIGFQIVQSYSYKKFDNFLEFNKMYDSWYGNMPAKFSENAAIPFDSLDGTDKAWVRKYFNIYVQEYYFYKNGMIPPEMWENLIHGCRDGKLLAAFCNLKKYPALLEGYCDWKHETGSFRFPEDFREIFEKDLKKCNISLQDACGDRS